ncbi:putative F-box protein-like [Capsicum annuum]|nr:putative F-box protein-like [Capsicum annuum]
MGGQGKTTIARILYNNDRIVHHFDVRAWCIISQTYNWRELLQDILSQVTGSKDRGYKDDYLADMLRKSLMRKRYLIVLDDMWDGMAWNDLWRYFRVVGKRSTIIITTRLEKVGEHVKGHINPYYLPFLTTEESCQLLQKKVFQQEVFPPELQVVSQAVAERSNGLPLLVVLVAGIIKRKKMEASWWHKVRNSLCYYLGNSEEYTHSIMQLSYVNLHCHLRPCLLYMGMFPKDVRIPVPALISSWICEGFVQRDKSGKSLEETAEVLHFCLEKSREEKFMQSVKLQFRPSDGNKHQISLDWNANSAGIARRSFHQNLRSLIMNNAGEFANLDPFGLASKLRLLKVLDLSYIRVRDSSSATLEPLIHLKYLAFFTDYSIFTENHICCTSKL